MLVIEIGPIDEELRMCNQLPLSVWWVRRGFVTFFKW